MSRRPPSSAPSKPSPPPKRRRHRLQGSGAEARGAGDADVVGADDAEALDAAGFDDEAGGDAGEGDPGGDAWEALEDVDELRIVVEHLGDGGDGGVGGDGPGAAGRLDWQLRDVTLSERGLLVGVELRGEAAWPVEVSLDELASLAETAGVGVVGRAIQRLSRPQPSTLVGSGKVEEIKAAAADLKVDVVIVDRELSPRQQRNLESGLDLKVIDRTALILDIFAQHARTRDGMLQVELAQLEYRLPRLTRMWTHLARQAGGRAGGAGGGVGVRGPGETQLEIDRREIGRRIAFLKGQIETLRTQRRQSRQRRQRSGLPTIALVGYTNAGKSTLANALLGETAIYAADQLFATLDPTTRRVQLSNGRQALLSDTVGFIQRLPTELVAAFRATLEEVTEADVLLHVVDLSHPAAVDQAETVESVLADLGLVRPPMAIAVNKIDRVIPADRMRALGERPDGAALIDALEESATWRALTELYPDAVPISAAQGIGLDGLREALDESLRAGLVAVELLVPYRDGDLLHRLHVYGTVDREAFEAAGTRVSVQVPPFLLGEVAPYRVG